MIGLLLIVLLGSVAALAHAEPRNASQSADEFAAIAEEMFTDFFAETEGERDQLETASISPAEESRLGEAAIDELLASLKERRIRVHKNGRDVGYVKSLVAEIRPLMANADRYRRIHVYVVSSKVTDAQALPGGIVLVSTAMIDFAQSEAALIGVLAHELAHIDRGHLLRRERSIQLVQQPWNASSAEDAMRQGMLLAKQFARPFHPEDETEADLDATRWMFALGYDPLEMALLFRRLDERVPVDAVRMPSFLRSHPCHADRYAAVRELGSQLQWENPDVELYTGRENLRQRISRRAQQFAE